VPLETLRRKVNKAKNGEGVEKLLGRPTVLNKDAESELSKIWIWHFLGYTYSIGYTYRSLWIWVRVHECAGDMHIEWTDRATVMHSDYIRIRCK